MIVTHRLLRTLLCSSALMLTGHAALAAFDPQAGGEPTVAAGAFNPQIGAAVSPALPDTQILYNTPRSANANGAVPLPTAPLYPSRSIVMPSAPPALAIAPAAPPAAAAPLAVTFPPVDPAVAAQAHAQLHADAPAPAAAVTAAQTPASAPAQLPGFVAPAPLIALSPASVPEPTGATPAAPHVVAAAPAVAATPATPTPATQPIVVAHSAPAATELPPVVTPAVEPLTRQSKTILSQIPSKLDSVKPTKSTQLKLDRVSPEVAEVLGKDAKDASYEAVGLSIKVSRPGLDTNFELNHAYTSLMGGDTDSAIQTYKNILSVQPTNQDALFGLAATYHRLGNLDKARPLYGELLKLNPNHREGLNNFLALISDESPQEALAELERLEQRNPDFSPIPAQEAIVLDKLGYVEESRAKMLRAIDLAPDNLTYKYNLAVMSDRNGNYADAGALYRLLIDASLHGAAIPAPMADLQKRLNFITTVAASDGRAIGG